MFYTIFLLQVIIITYFIYSYYHINIICEVSLIVRIHIERYVKVRYRYRKVCNSENVSENKEEHALIIIWTGLENKLWMNGKNICKEKVSGKSGKISVDFRKDNTDTGGRLCKMHEDSP